MTITLVRHQDRFEIRYHTCTGSWRIGVTTGAAAHAHTRGHGVGEELGEQSCGVLVQITCLRGHSDGRTSLLDGSGSSSDEAGGHDDGRDDE